MTAFLFEGLSNNEVELAKGYFENPVPFSKGNELYKIGYIGVLLEGSATVKRNHSGGASISVRNITAGAIFGSVSIFGDWKDGLSSITAQSKGLICYICEEKFKALLFAFPQVSLNYIAFLSDRLRFLNSNLDIFTANSTEAKLYKFLSSLADEQGYVDLTINMSELAHRLNVGRSSLYRDIDSLTQKGLITRQNNVFIINRI